MTLDLLFERALERPQTTPRATRGVPALGGLLRHLARAAAERRVRRRRYHTLRGLSDHLLRDIGISEAEIRNIRALEVYPTLEPQAQGRLIAR